MISTNIASDELHEVLASILDRPGLTTELGYRVRRLVDRFAPMADMIYPKTVRGKELIMLCAHKARALGEHLESGDDAMYRLLTDLEETFEELLRNTYEFRIKAG